MKFTLKIYLFAVVFSFNAFTQMPAPTPPAAKDLIHFGDLVDLDVVGSMEFDWRGRLNPEGFLDGLDNIENQIYALCRSENEIASEVAKQYAKFLRDPQVVVKILDRSNRAVAVLDGAVKMPQRFQIRRIVLLSELIVISGGITEKASGDITIFRPAHLSCRSDTENFVKASRSNASQTLTITISALLSGKKDANPEILSGDIVTVREAAPIYVIGGVNSPARIPTRSEITLSRAIATAGGLSKDGLEEKITVYRREGRETKIIEANLKKIEAKQSEDLLLKAFDIVEVGQKGREKRKIAPVISNTERPVILPLTIID